MLRKQILGGHTGRPLDRADEIDVSAVANVLVTSESAENPIDNAFDGSRGLGATRWVAGEEGVQTLVLAFDSPQDFGRIALEVEETETERRQEVSLSLSLDGGLTYRDVVRQEYNFSPQGATFEREEWLVKAIEVTHLRLVIRPDKEGKPCRATLTSLVLG